MNEETAKRGDIGMYHLDDGDILPAVFEKWLNDGRTAVACHVLFNQQMVDKYGDKEGWFSRDFIEAKGWIVPECCVVGTDCEQFTFQQKSPLVCDDGGQLPVDRETLGRFVRESWVRWAKEQPTPKLSWLVPFDDLPEEQKEVDRRIGEDIARWTLLFESATEAINYNKDHRPIRASLVTDTIFDDDGVPVISKTGEAAIVLRDEKKSKPLPSWQR